MRNTSCSEHASVDLKQLNIRLASSINDKLCRESPSLSENCIFKVPMTLRRCNGNIYDPKIVSIGPFHHGKDDRFLLMEKMKEWYLHCLLNRLPLPPEETLELIVESIRKEANQAINYYAEKVDFSEDKFVEMMVVDGCFLIELFRKEAYVASLDKDDPIFNTSWMHENLYHDLILLENQIPWFVLKNLFYLTVSPYEQEEDFLVKLVLKFFETKMLMTVPTEYNKSSDREIKHILDLLHSSFLCGDIEQINTKLELFPPVTDLLRAGVNFKKGTPDCILNITFRNGNFAIPPIIIRGNSESLFRNLIAYEQCDRDCNDKFTSYAVFLDCLINTSRDADLLCDKGIIMHGLSTEDVSLLFNGLYNDTLLYQYQYGKLAHEVNKYYRSRWPRWRATLKRDYFRNPWSISSFIAAILILVFTFTQTMFSILSY